MRIVTLGEIVNHEESRRALELLQQTVTRIADDIITPALPRINAWTGQQNDARFLAYVVVVSMAERFGEIVAEQLKAGQS